MKLDWKWIGLGALIMIALNVAAGIIMGVVLAAQLGGATDTVELHLSGGHIAFAAALYFLAFALGGFIVGVKSAGRTILEPAIAAAVAVAIGLWLSGNFAVGNVFAVGLVPFFAGLLGGWLGERRQESKSSA